MLTASIATLLTLTSTTVIGPASSPGAVAETEGIINDRFTVISDTEIIADGVTYNSWEELAQAGYHHLEDTRCKTVSFNFGGDAHRGDPGDCTFGRTRIMPEYDPSVDKYRIPVVVHIITNSSGSTGNVPDSRVYSQIDVLNEDFQAIAGTNGAPGTDVQIEFYLADVDPNGNPTTGITRSANTTWFNDGGAYYNTLAWDTNRYLNIYTNSASGALGYVPALPQSGIAGSNSDRVVVLYSTFGRNAPYVPFHLGRTTTHEVGHYLGLEHTFAGGTCSNSYTSGDLIVDTNPESSPTFGCPGNRTSCGSQAPFHNYMDYSDDICMNQFTPEQANRMRCSLINYRPNLYTVAGPTGCSDADLAEPYGELNFFDISAYLAAFNSQDPAADFDLNGSFDFFDVSLFLGLYNFGCP